MPARQHICSCHFSKASPSPLPHQAQRLQPEGRVPRCTQNSQPLTCPACPSGRPPVWRPSGRAQRRPRLEGRAAPERRAAPAAASGDTAGPVGGGKGEQQACLLGGRGSCPPLLASCRVLSLWIPVTASTGALLETRQITPAALTHHRYSRAAGMGWIRPSAMVRCSQASPRVTASTVVGLPLLALHV